MEQKKSLLVSKLETSDDIEKVKFNDELKKLDMEIEAYKSTKQQYAKQLNDLIGAKNLEEMKEIEAVSANVDKITVKDQQDKVRSFKKILHFSDFRAMFSKLKMEWKELIGTILLDERSN